MRIGIVVPRVGTWIEIEAASGFDTIKEVVPRVGTWIEIKWKWSKYGLIAGRPPRGDVD